MVKSQKCPNCGANLKLDKLTGILQCNNCDSTFSLDKNNIPEEFNLIDNGNKFIKLKEYEKAFECFEKACNVSPDNYACWLGLAKAISKNFKTIDESNIKEAKKFVTNAKNCATDEDLKTLENELKNYYSLVESFEKKQKQEKQNNSYQNKLQLTTLAIFIILAIASILVICLSVKDAFIWKVVDIVIILAINSVLYFFIPKLLLLLKFKTKKQIIISIIIYVIIMLTVLGINIYALTTM